jgi:hypothetical protein
MMREGYKEYELGCEINQGMETGVAERMGMMESKKGFRFQ